MRKFVLLVAGLGLAASASAQVWNEAVDGGGDAGELPATAQVVTGTGPLTAILGSWLINDTDMYQILICDEANFSATTVGGTTADTQLWLFDANGAGVAFNDDSGGLQSTITSLFVNSNGLYYLAITKYNRDAVNAANQLIWNNSPFGTERAPDGPGAGNPVVANWTGTTSAGGDYRITLTGACFVPEPTSALLLGLGALALIRRR